MDGRLRDASYLIQKAVGLESKGRYTDCIIYYQEGLRMYLEYSKAAPPNDRAKLRQKIEEFMSRAERVKEKVDTEMQRSTYHEEIIISNNDTGHSYDSLFGRYLKQDVLVVKVEDPYIKAHHQFCNLVRFCELVANQCPFIQTIILHTKQADGFEQSNFFNSLKNDLRTRNIQFDVEYSSTLHDRQITLSNGWVIKIGRGLDYFKPAASKLGLGTFDMNLRPCSETKVDIYFIKDLQI